MEEKQLETKLTELRTELKTYFDKAAEEQKANGVMHEETKTKIDAIQKQLDGIDLKLVEKHVQGTPEKTITEELQENEDVCRLMKNKKGHAVITFKGNNAAQLWDRGLARIQEQKTILRSALGYITPGIIDADRMPGIVLEPRRTLRVRDALSARPTTLPVVYWAKVNAPLATASPMMQQEGLVKHESTVTFTTASSTVRTIATFIKASRQALDDFAELGGFLQTGLPYYVNRQEETQLLSGDDTGDNLNGLITQATSYNTALNSSSFTRIDQIARAIEQIGIADEVDPSFVILNKRDWWDIRVTKDSFGRYILGDPQSVGDPTLWGLTPIATNSIAAGTFLVGSGDPAAAEIRDRMEMQVEISTEDSDNFQRNLVTIRAEKRMLLAVMRPGSFITGSFAQSPA